MFYILQHINKMFIEPRRRWHVSCLLWQGISEMQNIDADALPLMCSMVFCHKLYSLYVLLYDSYFLEFFYERYVAMVTCMLPQSEHGGVWHLYLLHE